MSSYNILHEDWSDYDERKKDSADRYFFACEEEWEVHYLVRKIRKQYPHLTTDELKVAIHDCCRKISAPRPRPLFVQCVLRKFGLT